jgi:hypothetical protein
MWYGEYLLALTFLVPAVELGPADAVLACDSIAGVSRLHLTELVAVAHDAGQLRSRAGGSGSRGGWRGSGAGNTDTDIVVEPEVKKPGIGKLLKIHSHVNESRVGLTGVDVGVPAGELGRADPVLLLDDITSVPPLDLLELVTVRREARHDGAVRG